MSVRSSNFCNSELEMIVNTMEEFPELVSGEFSAKLPTRNDHTKRWEILAKELTSINMGISRNWKQVRNKWNDLKYRTKQKYAKIKKFTIGTGGGPSQSKNLSELEERIIAIIGKRCVESITDESSDTSILVSNFLIL